ncbi:MAG: preprotein translocase subunit YajC [Sphingomonadales bacterium]|nr:MAG: preprotein translocase subunit YajC [Sphingomonadales bacterium]
MLISTAYAQTAAPGAAPSPLFQIVPFIAIFAIFYFLLIRPQQKRMKAHREMISSVKRGDTVVTAGGLIGKVTRVQDDEVQVELAENVRVRAVKSTLTDIRTKSDTPANDTDKK